MWLCVGVAKLCVFCHRVSLTVWAALLISSYIALCSLHSVLAQFSSIYRSQARLPSSCMQYRWMGQISSGGWSGRTGRWESAILHEVSPAFTSASTQFRFHLPPFCLFCAHTPFSTRYPDPPNPRCRLVSVSMRHWPTSPCSQPSSSTQTNRGSGSQTSIGFRSRCQVADNP